MDTTPNDFLLAEIRAACTTLLENGTHPDALNEELRRRLDHLKKLNQATTSDQKGHRPC